MNRELCLIAHNLRSTHNVGSLLRTAEGLGVSKVYLTGYTPYPHSSNDARLPHLAEKIHKQIDKTALGATISQEWEYIEDVREVIEALQQQKTIVVALEQTPDSKVLPAIAVLPSKIAFVVGREVEGLEPEVVELCDMAVQIPMAGHKESFNVSVAAAMALYQARFFSY